MTGSEYSLIPDFRGVSDPNEIKRRFYRAAKAIMFGWNLRRHECCWQITALELYLYSPYWQDPTTHGHKFGTREQLESSTWYVHRDGNLPPKRLGIDITAGCKSPEMHAGLLIAAIDDFDGSGRALKTIIRGRCDNSDWDYSPTEKNLIKTVIHRSSIWSNPPNLRLEQRSERKPGLLWVGKRKFPKGMRDKTPEPFLSCPLRIATWPTDEDTMEPASKVCPDLID